MLLDDYYYELPDELIAQYPSHERGKSRMMVVKRKTGQIIDDFFYCLPKFLNESDVLVINDSKVIPARIIGKKETGGSVEVLLLSKISLTNANLETWEVLLKPARKLRTGMKIGFDGRCEGTLIERRSNKKWVVSFTSDMSFISFLEKYGRAPLPPYIKRRADEHSYSKDIERYQTIYARSPGSVAAPTAGLHFSEDILNDISEKGVKIVRITLHVGYGTFMPIETTNIENHIMDEEYFEVSKETADIVNQAKRVVAVGTTSTRALESASDKYGKLKPVTSTTNLFIYPGYRFKRVDVLLTNFHLPGSSLLLLVSAFAGKDLIKTAYLQAINNRYLFYSYGDCMLII